MTSRRSPSSQSGSVLLWAMIWLIGMGALTWAAFNYAMPRFEKKRDIAISDSVSSVTDADINVDAHGLSAIVSGSVESSETKKAVLEAIGLNTGVLRVRDNLKLPRIAANSPQTGGDASQSSTSKPISQAQEKDQRPSLSIKIVGESLSIEGELSP
ncbi:MAG: hypothetical protein KTR32_13375, partial [Granulosicoccus sp.]|nr:hypothetical protein [Granulosicoccus sp.]